MAPVPIRSRREPARPLAARAAVNNRRRVACARRRNRRLLADADGDIAVVAGTALIGYVALTVGASGTDVTVKLRRTGTSGTTVVSLRRLNAPAAGDLLAYSISGFRHGYGDARSGVRVDGDGRERRGRIDR
jgi:hypothetical protein